MALPFKSQLVHVDAYTVAQLEELGLTHEDAKACFEKTKQGFDVVRGDHHVLAIDLLYVHSQILPAAADLIEHLAGDQWAEEEIDKAFDHPGLGTRVNALRRAIRKE